MIHSNPTLPIGFYDVPPGHIVAVVTDLEMLEAPSKCSGELPPGYSISRLDSTDLNGFRTLFRSIGTDWLWFSRLMMTNDQLSEVLTGVEGYVVRHGDEDIGLLELDFREADTCELSFIGLIPEYTNKGLGRALMDKALNMGWSRGIKSMWVHTCTFDHPGALGFYIKSGFKPCAYKVEVQVDPRLTGLLPADSSKHVPIIT